MGYSEVRAWAGRPPGADEPAFDLTVSKLLRPPVRPGTVSRPALLERLAAGDSRPIVSVTAPPGYGKTTLLSQWAERDDQTFAWVSVDAADNDPKVLLTYIAEALNAIEPIGRRVFDALASPVSSVPGSVVPRLGSAFSSLSSPVVLIIDDVHTLDNSECRAAVSVLADHVPNGSRLVLAGRAGPPLRVGAVLRRAGIVESYATPLVCAVRAHVAWHRGDAEAARRELVSGQRIRPVLTYALPHLAVQARIELSRVHLALADLAGARTLLREIDDILKRRPDLGTLADEARELRARLARENGPSVPGVSALTAAELRLLPLLATHLSFPEIAGELFLSPHTVKSQATSIYRKLGASSRSEAVARSRELTLLRGLRARFGRLPGDAAEADVAGAAPDGLGLPGGRPVAAAVRGRAQMRPALDRPLVLLGQRAFWTGPRQPCRRCATAAAYGVSTRAGIGGRWVGRSGAGR
jgi:DNA-binding CsgD family transcriptional regulator